MKERGNEDNLNTVLMSTFSKTKNLNKKINKNYLFQKNKTTICTKGICPFGEEKDFITCASGRDGISDWP